MFILLKKTISSLDSLSVEKLACRITISKTEYKNNIPQKSIIEQLQKKGVTILPGQIIHYVYQKGKVVLPEDYNGIVDVAEYEKRLVSFGAAVSPSIEAMLSMWEENLDVRINLLQTEWAIFLQDLHQQRFQMFGGLGWIADYPDPENFLDVLFHSKSSNNQSEYVNFELDLLLERARVELDESARFELYHRAEEIIVADAPWVPLWHSNGGSVLIKPNVNDYFLFPLVIPKYRYVYFTE